jgi:hypothetical protein
MHPTGRGWALLPAAVIAMLLAGCTGTSAAPGPGKAAPAAASGRSPTQPEWFGNVVSSAGRRICAGVRQLHRRQRHGSAIAGRAGRSRASGQSPVPSAADLAVRRRQRGAAAIREDRPGDQAGYHVRTHRSRPVHQPAQYRVGACQACRITGSWSTAALTQAGVAGLRGRVLDRSPGLRADHRQGRQQTADGAHRPRNGVPPASDRRKDQAKASHGTPCPERPG